MDTTKDNDLTYEEKSNNYPPARAPISPVISFSSLAGKANNPPPSISDATYKRFVTSGRIATALALINENISTGDEVLVPAYHCESMVAPVRHTGAKAVFYRINPDTTINMGSITSLLTDKTRALVVTHFFGFPQDVKALRDFCDHNKLVMIEDCAHSFFGKFCDKPVGYYADYAIASTMKFFPVFDGGVLASNRHNLDSIMLEKPSLHMEIKAFITIIERAVAFKRLSLFGKVFGVLARIKDFIWSTIKAIFFKHRGSESIGPSAAEGGFSFDPAWLNTKASKVSRYIINNTNNVELVKKRRKIYRLYVEALKNIPTCHILHPKLAEHTVPVVVPIYFDNCSKVFEELKNKGVPIWHFGEFLDPLVKPSTCPISYEYSQKIIQFPCHQELTKKEIGWIIRAIKSACSNCH